MAKTKAFMDVYEGPNDNSLSARYFNALDASRLADVAGMVTSANSRSSSVQHNVTSETHIGEVNVHTPATDPRSHANAVAQGITDHPLLSPSAQGSVALSTRAMQ
jgi:hypothetical protein